MKVAKSAWRQQNRQKKDISELHTQPVDVHWRLLQLLLNYWLNAHTHTATLQPQLRKMGSLKLRCHVAVEEPSNQTMTAGDSAVRGTTFTITLEYRAQRWRSLSADWTKNDDTHSHITLSFGKHSMYFVHTDVSPHCASPITGLPHAEVDLTCHGARTLRTNSMAFPWLTVTIYHTDIHPIYHWTSWTEGSAWDYELMLLFKVFVNVIWCIDAFL